MYYQIYIDSSIYSSMTYDKIAYIGNLSQTSEQAAHDAYARAEERKVMGKPESQTSPYELGLSGRSSKKRKKRHGDRNDGDDNDASAKDSPDPAVKRGPRPRGPFGLSVPQAGALVGLGRNASYEAAARGEIPTLKIGGLLIVPKLAWFRKIGAEEAKEELTG